MGGHLVSGHIDGQAEIVERKEEGDAVRFALRAPEELAPFIAQKGSVALDGTSLTVNGVNGNEFDVLLIRHSLEVTTGAIARLVTGSILRSISSRGMQQGLRNIRNKLRAYTLKL